MHRRIDLAVAAGLLAASAGWAIYLSSKADSTAQTEPAMAAMSAESYAADMAAKLPESIEAARTDDACLQFNAQRQLALDVIHSARVLPFVEQPTERTALFEATAAGVDALLFVQPDGYINSSYGDCYGNPDATEQQTINFVLKALSQWSRHNPDPRIERFVAESWRALDETGWLENFRRMVEAELPNPNAFAQYLSMAVIAERAGIDALLDYAPRGVDALLGLQATSEATATCDGPEGPVPQVYGGWFHNRASQDCAQEQGYAWLIVEPLVELHDLLEETGRCDAGEWRPLCPRILSGLEAALGWIVNIRDPETGLFLNPAPGTGTAEPELVNSSIATGLGATIIAKLRRAGYADADPIPVGYDGETVTLAKAEAIVRDAAAAERKNFDFLAR